MAARFRTSFLLTLLVACGGALLACSDDATDPQNPFATNTLLFTGNLPAEGAQTVFVRTIISGDWGEARDLGFEFQRRSGEQVWDWSVEIVTELPAGTQESWALVSGDSGTISFTEQGQIVSMLAGDGGRALRFKTSPDAATHSLALDPLGSEDYLPVTQIDGPASLIAIPD